MNILILPSWYPSFDNPIAGIFVKEQVEGLAKLNPHYSFTVIKPLIINSFKTNIKKFLKAKIRHTTNTLFDEIEIECNFIIPSKLNKINLFFKLQYIYEAYIIKKALKKKPINIVHAHVSYPGGYLAMHLSKILGVPYIITEHMSPFPFEIDPYYKNGMVTKLVTDPLKRADRIIAVSTSLARRIAEFNIGYPQVIPNMINEEFFHPKPNINAFRNKNNFKFLSIGSLNIQKGFDVLIQAFTKIIDKFPNSSLIIGGEGEGREIYEGLAKELGVDNKIYFTGLLNRVQTRNYLLECDAFILASRHETFGCVYAEAIACGKPIIATLCGGPEDIVNSINGLLCKIDDVEDLASKMLLTMENIDNYESKLIRDDFMQRFSQQAVSDTIISLYKELQQ